MTHYAKYIINIFNYATVQTKMNDIMIEAMTYQLYIYFLINVIAFNIKYK